MQLLQNAGAVLKLEEILGEGEWPHHLSLGKYRMDVASPNHQLKCLFPRLEVKPTRS